MHRVRSLGVLSVAKIMGAVYGLLGFLFMPFFLLMGFVGSLVGQRSNPFGAIAPLALGILFPIIYGLIGFIGGALLALFYNLVAGWLGGIEIRLEPTVSLPTVG